MNKEHATKTTKKSTNKENLFLYSQRCGLRDIIPCPRFRSLTSRYIRPGPESIANVGGVRCRSVPLILIDFLLQLAYLQLSLGF